MSAYSPAPWKAQEKLSASENHKGFSIRSADGWWIADVSPMDPDVSAAARANARLIAAAPTLADALQEAAEFIEDQVDVVDGSYGEPQANRAMQLMRVIEEALAAAGIKS